MSVDFARSGPQDLVGPRRDGAGIIRADSPEGQGSTFGQLQTHFEPSIGRKFCTEDIVYAFWSCDYV